LVESSSGKVMCFLGSLIARGTVTVDAAAPASFGLVVGMGDRDGSSSVLGRWDVDSCDVVTSCIEGGWSLFLLMAIEGGGGGKGGLGVEDDGVEEGGFFVGVLIIVVNDGFQFVCV
jgi:hypothetical protein